jgi:hypothetical protein
MADTLLLLSTYEIWKVLVSLAKKNIESFLVLILFMPKKQLESEKNSVCQAAFPVVG